MFIMYLTPRMELPMSGMAGALTRLRIGRWVIQMSAVSIIHRHDIGIRPLLLLVLWLQRFLLALFGHVAHAHATVGRTFGMVNHAPSINETTQNSWKRFSHLQHHLCPSFLLLLLWNICLLRARPAIFNFDGTPTGGVQPVGLQRN